MLNSMQGLQICLRSRPLSARTAYIAVLNTNCTLNEFKDSIQFFIILFLLFTDSQTPTENGKKRQTELPGLL